MAGNYKLTVVDSNGCKIAKEITLTPPPALTINTVATGNPTGYGLSNGFIEVTLSGGTPPYTYNWKTQSGTVLPSDLRLENLPKDVYVLEVEDVKGCKTTQTYELTQPAKLEVTIVKTSIISCNGSSDGALQAKVTGGVPAYTFTWFKEGNSVSIGTSSVATNLSAAIYYVVIEDANGNKVESEKFELTEPELLNVALTYDYVNCGLGAEWTVTSNVTGGTAPYTYLWNTGANTENIENVIANTYEVTVVDINGCKTTQKITIQLPEPLLISNDNVTDPTCYQGNDGKIVVEVEGGTGPYKYNWNNGATTETIENLSAGEYTVIITDSRGCTITESYTVTSPEQIYLELGDTITLCKGQTTILDGTIADGAQYFWTSNNGFTSTNAIIEVSKAGTYTLKAIDVNGCEAIDEITIKTSDKDIMSDFIVSTQVFKSESVVAVNISTPKPDESTWIIPDAAQLIEEGSNYIELLFNEVGKYDITLVTRIGDCEEYKTKTVFVVEKEIDGTPETVSGNQPMIQAFVIYPNPSSGRFTLDVTLRKENPLSVRIYGIYNNNVISTKKVDGDKEYSLAYDLNLTTGVYIVLIETENERLVKKIVIE